MTMLTTSLPTSTFALTSAATGLPFITAHNGVVSRTPNAMSPEVSLGRLTSGMHITPELGPAPKSSSTCYISSGNGNDDDNDNGKTIDSSKDVDVKTATHGSKLSKSGSIFDALLDVIMYWSPEDEREELLSLCWNRDPRAADLLLEALINWEAITQNSPAIKKIDATADEKHWEKTTQEIGLKFKKREALRSKIRKTATGSLDELGYRRSLGRLGELQEGDKPTGIIFHEKVRLIELVLGGHHVPKSWADNLKQEPWFILDAVVKSLAQLGEPAIPTLIKWLAKKEINIFDINILTIIIVALGMLGLPALEQLVIVIEGHNDDNEKLWAQRAIEKIADPRALMSLIALLDTDNPRLRESAARALSTYNTQGGPIAALTEKEIEIAINGMRRLAIGRVPKGQDATFVIIRALAQSWLPALKPLIDEIERNPNNWWAQLAIGTIKDPDAVDPLIALLDAENSELRVAAALALGSIGDERAIDRLTEHLEDEDEVVRESVREALREIQEPPNLDDTE